ncbi:MULTISPECIES: SpoIIIAC/SpoIIIAD family protein [Clostridiaceae]|uniref:Stage III sporulation protein AD n=1 Tax=Clostridium facile TaxID=2763035 RepID=A0ABR7IN59_9CLOT|nr:MULTISPECIES: SpoIIIAC/SpoIIIAD family protein [Clostridiaceae]MBC5786575.1 stage III sporulation protein AD [Clostridium facile]PWM99201.1 MAG: stage III sporulation protein AD [Massilioclostridium sp.]
MLFSVVGIALVTTCICVLLKQWNPEISMMAALLCGILIFGIILVNLTPVLDTIGKLVAGVEFDSGYLSVVLKSLGICYVTQLAADTCRDSGYSSIASKVELAGKVSVIVIAMPLFTNLVQLSVGLIQLGS